MVRSRKPFLHWFKFSLYHSEDRIQQINFIFKDFLMKPKSTNNDLDTKLSKLLGFFLFTSELGELCV